MPSSLQHRNNLNLNSLSTKAGRAHLSKEHSCGYSAWALGTEYLSCNWAEMEPLRRGRVGPGFLVKTEVGDSPGLNQFHLHLHFNHCQ